MNRLTLIAATAIVAAIAIPAREAAAQWNVARFDATPNRVYTTFGLDPAFVSAVGWFWRSCCTSPK